MRTKNFIREYSEVLLALISITLITFLVIGGFSRDAQYGNTRTYSVEISQNTVDTYDISSSDFNDRVYQLTSTHYYPELLLTPENIDEYDYVSINPDVKLEYLTQRFKIKVPQTGQAYKINMEGDFYSALAFANGQVVDSSGMPADNSDEVIIGRTPLSIYASPDEEGYIDLIIQLASFRHSNEQAEPLVAYVSLVNTAPGYVFTPVGRSFDAVLVGIYVGFGMLTLALFFTHINQTENLWLAVVCMFTAINSGMEGGTFSEIIPIATENFVYYAYYLGQPIIMFFFMMYFSTVFSDIIPNAMLWIMGILTLILIAIISLTDPIFFTSLISTYSVVSPIAYLLFLIPFFMKMKSFWPEHIISLFGMVALALATLYDFIVADNVINSESYTFTDIAMLLLIVTQLIYLFMMNRRRTLEAMEYSRIVRAERETLRKLDILKTRFLANISHELKTPLAVISGYAQTSSRSLEHGGTIAENTKRIRLISSEADRLALMVSQLLDVAKIEEEKMVLKRTPTQLDAMIKTTLDTYCPALNKNNNRVIFNRVYDLPDVNIDEVRIRQVIVNLIANAMRHTVNGEIRIDIELENKHIKIGIADNGPGIPKDLIPVLFERYAKKESDSGNETGTGLGLFICKHIVEAHGGKINVESAEGIGTSIYFTIPTLFDDSEDNAPEELK